MVVVKWIVNLRVRFTQLLPCGVVAPDYRGQKSLLVVALVSPLRLRLPLSLYRVEIDGREESVKVVISNHPPQLRFARQKLVAALGEPPQVYSVGGIGSVEFKQGGFDGFKFARLRCARLGFIEGVRQCAQGKTPLSSAWKPSSYPFPESTFLLICLSRRARSASSSLICRTISFLS